MFAPYSEHRCSETNQNQKALNDLGLASPSCLDTLQLDDSLQLYLMSSIELGGFMLVNSQSTYLSWMWDQAESPTSNYQPFVGYTQ